MNRSTALCFSLVFVACADDSMGEGVDSGVADSSVSDSFGALDAYAARMPT